MSNLGHSGAEISVLSDVVLKEGNGVREQGFYVEILGPAVCPEVRRFTDHGYVMEKLYEWKPLNRLSACERILQRLRLRVWNRPAAIQHSFRPDRFIDWTRYTGSQMLGELFKTIYGEGFPLEVLTHGDATVANVMQTRESWEIKLIDPIPPRERVPSWKEVDEGKVLQSYMGWEDILNGSTMDPVYRNSDCYVGPYMEEVLISAEAWFWLAVHCQRILPYAKREDIKQWASLTQQEAIQRCSRLL